MELKMKKNVRIEIEPSFHLQLERLVGTLMPGTDVAARHKLLTRQGAKLASP